MKKARLGRTGAQVSRIGFGGIPIQRLAEPEAIRVVQHCLELGVTFLDTANGYSTSEERIGQALAAWGGRREQLFIATKTGARDRATARQHLDLSLSRLWVEAIDLWQMHNVSTPQAYEQVLGPGGALEAAHCALDAGLVRHVGISSHSMEIARQAVSSGLFETLQFPFNLVTREPLDELIPLARRYDVGFIAMKPLGGGLLNNAKLCLKFLFQFDDIVPDPGIQKVEEIDEIAAIVAGSWDLTSAEWEAIDSIRQQVGVHFCRRCGYCEPCPQGVHISTLMNLVSAWKRMPVARLATGWIAEAVRSAEGCIKCGECEEKCPYRLLIREMIAENMALYEQVLQAEAAL